VSSRLTHPDPPAGLADDGRPWPLRVADIDVLEHLNNAATWTAVEDEVHRRAPGRPIGSAELEYRTPTGPDAELRLCSRLEDGQARVWLIAEGEVQASAVTRFSRSGGRRPP
jgi:acyl-ACP thioesterase